VKSLKTQSLILALLTAILFTVSCSIMPDNSYSVRNRYNPHSGIKTAAESFLGVPYRYGGKDRYGMDCSGLVVAVFKKAFRLELPHSSHKLFKLGKDVEIQNLKTGDLVFFRSKTAMISHVGIYLGKNIFIHASSSRGVIESNLTSPYYRKRFIGAKRIVLSDINTSM